MTPPAPLHLPEHPTAAGLARRHVRAELQAWGLQDMLDEVLLLTTELVTNVLVHAASAPRLVVEREGAGVRITVLDDSPVLPAPRRFSTAATTGRGCQLLEELADEWDAERRESGGKAVWFVISGVRDPWAAFDAHQLGGVQP